MPLTGYLSLLLHAHLPFVRHPEHERHLEENWLFEAITEVYLPLIEVLEGWQRDGVQARLTLSLSPTLCAMLQDPLLQSRYERHLQGLIELAEKETHRTTWEEPFQRLAVFYHARLLALRECYAGYGGDLVAVFRKLQNDGIIEIITTAATHAVLPLLNHAPSVRAQVMVARDAYEACFGRPPLGMWLPECAYAPGLEHVLAAAGIRWFVTETHGLLHAEPRPRYGTFAPVFTRAGVAAFGRDHDSARQVWSRHEGYPGDPRYREFYRDAGFDLDLDYVRPHLAAPEHRGFIGLKYYAITGDSPSKRVYDRAAALRVVESHAAHFLEARVKQLVTVAEIMGAPPIVLAPYDAELFGHWWYEGPEFLDSFVRKAQMKADALKLVTPSDYLRLHPTHQLATPAASSWGEGGYWGVWLNEKNAWMYPFLRRAQEQMSALVQRFKAPDALPRRALRQAARELLMAQASDWPFILKTGTSPGYARERFEGHIRNFTALNEKLLEGAIDDGFLNALEERNNLFGDIEYRYWALGDD